MNKFGSGEGIFDEKGRLKSGHRELGPDSQRYDSQKVCILRTLWIQTSYKSMWYTLDNSKGEPEQLVVVLYCRDCLVKDRFSTHVFSFYIMFTSRR